MEYNFLSKTTLFMGCTAKEIEHMIICLKHKVKKYDKSNSLSYLEKLVDEYSKLTDYKSIFIPNAIKHYDDYGRFYKSISFYLIIILV